MGLIRSCYVKIWYKVVYNTFIQTTEVLFDENRELRKGNC